MKRPAIKICGLSTKEAIDHVIARRASHVGFIFFEKSPRYVEPDVAADLITHVRGRAKTVAVTVDADNDLLEEIVFAARPDMLQLHGHESPDRVVTVKALFGLPVIKAFSLRSPDDLVPVGEYDGVADHLLFDAKPPKNATLPGGNGVTFDWRLLAGWRPTIPYFLSGGLTAENVEAALMETGAPGLDVSSGVESAPGVKDAARIDAFFDAVDATCAAA